MKTSIVKRVRVIAIITVLLAVGVFLSETFFSKFSPIVTRNPYGEGAKIEAYEVQIEGVDGTQTICIEVQEREYVGEEVQELLRRVMDKLDRVVLGENSSFDRVETDLNLVSSLDGYPVEIMWELDSYDTLTLDGEIKREDLPEEGVLVELRGTISYHEDSSIYIRSARICPVTRNGADRILYELQKELQIREESTRGDETFSLPNQIEGKRLSWNQKKDALWPFILMLGTTVCVYLVYREKEKVRKEKVRRQEELKRDYPALISKLTMLLSTGATLRNAWERIAEHYEKHKEQLGQRIAYEEMQVALYEMKSGISEGEAYEHFGKRCGDMAYVKLGTLLSQNLRKGSKGLSDILKMEAIQAFENRKSLAKRKGEEAGAKLMVPMLGMLAVVFVMIMVPAFLTLQI